MHQKNVLITGCSSGIGKALAREFLKCGLNVIATARTLDSISDLKSEGMMIEQLDVLDKDQMHKVVQKISDKGLTIDILVNNAGYGLIGPLIETYEETLLKQFQTNLFSVLQLTQQIVPLMKKEKYGLIINIGSISGILTSPFSGAYCASKSSLHIFSDALRMELAPFGIRVLTVQTGAIQSNFGKAAKKSVSEILKPDSWYQKIEDKILMRAEYSQVNASPVELFAKQLAKQALKSNPPAIVKLGKMSRLFPMMKLLLPMAMLDRIFKKKFGLDQSI